MPRKASSTKSAKAVKAKAKPSPKTPKKLPSKGVASHLDMVRLTHGGHDYIECVLNPRAGPLARVPYGFPVRSRTLRVKCTGTFTANGPTGDATAWCAFNPWRAIANGTACVYATGSTYTGNDTVAMDIASAGIFNFSSNSDYSGIAGSLDETNVAFRLVGAELNVSTTSSSLTRQGSLFVFTEPSHENLVAQAGSSIPGITPAKVMTYEGARVRAVPMGNTVERCIWGTPEKPGEVEWLSFGQLQDELGYLVASGLSNNQANAYLSGDMGYGPWYGMNMVAICSGGCTGGAGGTATSFRFEAYAVFEIVGQAITGRGPGVSDPIAFQAASNYIQRTPGSTQINGTAKDALTYLGQQLGYVTPKGDVQYGSLVKDSMSAVAAAAKYLI
jgi:hypothetical protein